MHFARVNEDCRAHAGAQGVTFRLMKSYACRIILLCGLLSGALYAEEKPAGVTAVAVPAKVSAAATGTLKGLIERQRALLGQADEKTSQAEMEDMRAQFQELVFDYEDYLKTYPEVAAGYVSYALLLNQPVLGERKRAAALLLKANQLDANLPIVKNQLGNYLAEEGRPLDALNYYLAAVKLAPEEPLYHYQVGSLLTEAREELIKSGAWTRATLDQAMQDAFEHAMARAPGNIGYAYRYGQSFYDLERPEWSAALTFWRQLEEKVTPPVEKETIRLHQASVLIRQQKFAEARAMLATVKAAVLEGQKQKLVAQLAADSAK